jgi:hypothetical protein
MRTTTVRRSFYVILLSLALPLAASAQELALTFNAAGRSLTQAGNLPTVVAGGTFTVRVAGISADPGWRPVLGGQPVPFTSASATGAVFSTTVGSGVQPDAAGRVSLTIDDPAQQVRLAQAPLSLNFRARNTDNAAAVPRECNPDQRAQLTQPRERDDHVHLMFNENGFPLRRMPASLDENDAISITMLLPCAQAGKYTVALEGTLATGDMNILASGALQNVSKLRSQLTGAGPDTVARDTFFMGTFGPFAPPQVVVVIKRDGTEIRRHVLRVAKNYIAAFRLGVGQSDIRFNDFQLRAPAGGGTANVVTNRADEDGEPRYFLSMVFYAWHFWDNRFWNGRDISESPTLIDRVNPYVGFGLKDPGREYLAGVSLELARGLDVVWGVHVARTDQLTNGLTEGATFSGTRDALPTRYEWKTNTQFFGVSADLDAAVKALQGILGT